jgi:hypothetical protein
VKAPIYTRKGGAKQQIGTPLITAFPTGIMAQKVVIFKVEIRLSVDLCRFTVESRDTQGMKAAWALVKLIRFW